MDILFGQVVQLNRERKFATIVSPEGRFHAPLTNFVASEPQLRDYVCFSPSPQKPGHRFPVAKEIEIVARQVSDTCELT